MRGRMFDAASIYPDGLPGHVKDSDTSTQAAVEIQDDVKTLREKVLRYIARRNGATCDEVEWNCRMRHQTASARIRELVKLGLIRDSGSRRNTRSRRPAVVWVPKNKRDGQQTLWN